MSLVLCCRDAAAILTDEAEGALDGASSATFSFHMTVCVFCRRYRDQLKATVAVLRALPHHEGGREPEAEPERADVDAILGLLGRASGGDHQT